ncbi:MAG: ABC transporter substrate-binding protein [Gemmataceae bacterium]|nr:ABC transporter substrate-binding protein [Gemmataceae bacterium]
MRDVILRDGRLRRWLSLLIFACVAAVAGVGCNGFGTEETLLVGHLLPRTGRDAELGQALMTAAAITVDSWNQDEPKSINGRSVSVVHADTASQLDPFAFQTTRLLAVNQVAAVVGGIDSPEAERIRQALAARDNAPCGITMAGVLNRSPSSTMWGVGISPIERGRYLARFAAEDEKLAQVVIVVDTRLPTALDIHRAFVQEFRHPDRQIIAEHLVQSPEEMRAIVASWPDGSSAALVFVSQRDSLDNFLPLARGGKVKVLYAGEDEERVWRQPPEEPIFFATAFPGDQASDAFQRLATDFRQRCQQELSPASLLTAEAFRILLSAGKKARSLRRDSLQRELEKLEIDLPSGAFWFEKDGEARRPVSIFRAEKGQRRWMKSYRPEKQKK